MLIFILVIIILILVIISIIFFGINQTKASTSVSYKIKIKELREDSDLGYGELRLNGRVDNYIKIWNLVRVKDECEEGEELPLYCLQAELGFNNEGSESNGLGDHTVLYDKAFDMKLKSDKQKLNSGNYENDKSEKSVSEEEKLIIEKEESKEKYNKVVWLADNMYIPNQDTVEDKIEILKKAGIIEEEKLTNYTPEIQKKILKELKEEEKEHLEIDEDNIESLSDAELKELFYSECFLSDDIMEVVQQLAFWYIIHDGDSAKQTNYHKEKLGDLYCTENENEGTLEDDSYKELEDVLDSSISCGERRKCNYF